MNSLVQKAELNEFSSFSVWSCSQKLQFSMASRWTFDTLLATEIIFYHSLSCLLPASVSIPLPAHVNYWAFIAACWPHAWTFPLSQLMRGSMPVHLDPAHPSTVCSCEVGIIEGVELNGVCYVSFCQGWGYLQCWLLYTGFHKPQGLFWDPKHCPACFFPEFLSSYFGNTEDFTFVMSMYED